MPKARRSPVPKKVPMERRRRAKLNASGLEDAQFLNIDLDVRSRRSLALLVAAWPSAYQPLIAEGRPDPRWLILNAGSFTATAEVAAKRLLHHIARLRGDARQCWRQAHRRMFDIGVRAGGPGRPFEDVRLTADTLRRIAAAGAQIQVTVYPAEPESQGCAGRLSSRRQVAEQPVTMLAATRISVKGCGAGSVRVKPLVFTSCDKIRGKGPPRLTRPSLTQDYSHRAGRG